MRYTLGILIFCFSVCCVKPNARLCNAFDTPVGRAVNTVHETRRGEYHYLSMTSRKGDYVVLQNGTIWAVDPEEVNRVRGWIGPALIHIRLGSTKEGYGVTFKNMWTNDVIHVHRVTRAMVSPKPPGG